MKVKLSIIIPVYNLEKYLMHTIRSIIQQKFKNCEILVIDDFSNDGTLGIINDLLKFDSRIRVIRQSKNYGVSAARNIGIKEAKGEYLFFVDGDDYLSINALSMIIDRLKSKPDSLLINYNITDSKFRIISKKKLRFFEEQFPLQDVSGIYALGLLLEGKLSHWPFEAIVKRDMLIKNNVFFPENRNYGEDFATMYKVLFYSKKVSFLNNKIYNYVQRVDSVSHNHKVSDSYDYYKTVKEIDDFIDKRMPTYNNIKKSYLLPRLIDAYSIQCKSIDSDINFMKKIKNKMIAMRAGVKYISNRDKIKYFLIRLNILQMSN